MKAFYLFPLLAGALLVAACATTPEKRIARNPEIFESFPEDVRENVRRGIVEVGYDHDMVRLAMGEPHRVITRQRGDGLSEVWIYAGAYHTTDTYRVRDFGRFSTMDSHVVVDRTRRHVYERARVEFVDGKVSMIEQVSR